MSSAEVTVWSPYYLWLNKGHSLHSQGLHGRQGNPPPTDTLAPNPIKTRKPGGPQHKYTLI
jgi:hypothetical protein